MSNKTKNILSREGCKKELVRFAKGEMLPDIVLFGVMLLIFIPLICMSAYVMRYIKILGFLFALLCSIAPVIFICRIVLDAMTLRLVNKDCFSIEKDTVSRLSKGEFPKSYSEGKNYVDVLYFEKRGRYVATGITFNISSVGDEFYLVILKGKKEKIVFAYHSSMYDYREVA